MKEEDRKKLGEPETAYGKKRIHFFNSFEEEEEATLLYRMRMTPEERLALVTRMLGHFYSDELSRPRKFHRIVFEP